MTMLNKKIFALFVIAIHLHAQSSTSSEKNRFTNESIEGSGNIQSENRTHVIENKIIKTIAVSGSLHAIIKENEAPSFMSVTSDDNILSHIKTETHDEKLKIYFAPGSYTFTHAEVTIHVPYNLQQYKTSGCSKIQTSSDRACESTSCTLNASGCSKILFEHPLRKIDELSVDSSGTSHIEVITNNDIKKMAIHSSGCSKVGFAPRAKDVLIHYLIIKASGTSEVDLSSLKIARCKGKMSGVSKLSSNTIQSKDIEISGLAKHTEVHD